MRRYLIEQALFMKNDLLSYLNNQFLVAMPQLECSEFSNSLVYIISHNTEGAMGIIVNKEKPFHLADILEQLRPDTLFPATNLMTPIYHGGPIDTERGFVLHSKDNVFQNTINLPDIQLTSSQDVLIDIAEKKGPENYLIALGYAGWGAGQLEQEIIENTWLTCPFNADIIFKVAAEQRVDAALEQLGVNFSSLSRHAGHA